MTKRMLIDATHAEETRVVVLDGNRLEDFDVETSTKKQLKGNIYLAKIVRVEPSLQAAFVEYGGSRHGFLAFGEIHPDYYQIPVADRQRLIAQQEQEAREAEEAEDAAAQAEDAGQSAAPSAARDRTGQAEPAITPPAADPAGFDLADAEPPPSDAARMDPEAARADVDPLGSPEPAAQPAAAAAEPVIRGDEDFAPDNGAALESGPGDFGPRDFGPQDFGPQDFGPQDFGSEDYGSADSGTGAFAAEAALAELGLQVDADGLVTGEAEAIAALADALSDGEEGTGDEQPADEDQGTGGAAALPPPETVGGDTEDRERRTPSPRYLRHYKIQEVIRRRQILLVQVVKEERGGKGAALTTYISLAGRFCVLMPNSPRGGGISRKITSAADRRRLKEVTAEIGLPSGMGLIVRTAGAARPKPEIVRDCEYLLQLWDDIRDTTLKSMAPALIYEEASLIKRAIRDVYSRDVDEVLVDGQAAWHAARDQMRLLMPSHASKVQLWHDPAGQKLFAKHAVDAQLDAMLSPSVQLRSGGYLVINQTEALVAIDVNSGRSTRERGIEETALRTNLEAAEEVARQLRLRDLAGLIVIDFIDMEIRRNNAAVERKLKDALKNDRARIQIGVISPFGLMEMSRQRLRPSLAETSFVQCAQCSGTGLVRSTEGAAIHVLRAIEEEGGKRRSAEIMVYVAGPIALYILNHKRERLREIEARYGMTVLFTPDPTLLPPALKIDKLRALTAADAPIAPIPAPAAASVFEQDLEEDVADEVFEGEGPPAAEVTTAAGEPARAAEAEAGRRRRRRRRRGGRREDGARPDGAVAAADGGSEPALQDEQPELDDDRPERDGGAQTPTPGLPDEPATQPDLLEAASPAAPAGLDEEGGDGSANRRRGRRGGRRRRKQGEHEDDAAVAEPQAEPPVPAGYAGPTPADPFGGVSFDIFDVLEQAEARAEAAMIPATPAVRPVAAPEPVPPRDAAPEAADPEQQPAAEPVGLSPEPQAPPAPAAQAEPSAPTQPEPAPEPTPAEDADESPASASAPEPAPRRATAARASAAKPRKPRAGSKAALAAAAAEAAAAASGGTASTVPPAAEPETAPDAPAPTQDTAAGMVADTAAPAEPPAPKRGWWRR